MGIISMNNSRLTTEETWQKHWQSKKNNQFISDNYCFHDYIRHLVKKIQPDGTCIELGGFPGKFSIFFKKYCGLNPTLLDFYIDEIILRDLIEFNGLRLDDIKHIQADLFLHVPVERYDLVCSFGLIEHFTDIKEVINSHLKYMKPGALLIIALPNFRGVNGLLQRLFDPTNLAIHNLEIMSPFLLKNALMDIGMVDIQAVYYPTTAVWLENLDQRGIFVNVLVRILSRIVNFSGSIFGSQNKILSDSIFVSARSR